MALLVTAAPSRLTSQMKGMKGKEQHMLWKCWSVTALTYLVVTLKIWGIHNVGHCKALAEITTHAFINTSRCGWTSRAHKMKQDGAQVDIHLIFLPEAARQTLRSLKDTKTRHLIHKYFHQHVTQQVGEEQISSDWANWGRRTGQEAACVGCCTETEIQISPKTAWLCKLILQFAQKGHRDGKKSSLSVCLSSFRGKPMIEMAERSPGKSKNFTSILSFSKNVFTLMPIKERGVMNVKFDEAFGGHQVP